MTVIVGITSDSSSVLFSGDSPYKSALAGCLQMAVFQAANKVQRKGYVGVLDVDMQQLSSCWL